MLIPNPRYEKIERHIEERTENAAYDYETHPEFRKLTKKLYKMPKHAYVDKDGEHMRAAQALLDHADRQERVWVEQVNRNDPRAFAHAIESNPAHALPVAYLMAASIYEDKQRPKALSGSKELAVSKARKPTIDKKAMLETILLRGRIRGHNDPVADFKNKAFTETLADALAEKERLLLINAHDLDVHDEVPRPSRAVTLEALGKLCVEELQHRSILTQQPDGEAALYTFRNMVSAPAKQITGTARTQNGK